MQRIGPAIETRGLIREGQLFAAWRAVDTRLDRPVFVKIERPGGDLKARRVVAAHVDLWRRIARESITSTPTIVEIGQESGRWYVATEWIDRPTLRMLLEKDRPGPGFFDALARHCLEALAEFHDCGLVHGDVSAQNILCDATAARVHLIDPTPVRESEEISPFGPIVNYTPAFAAPEHQAGQQVRPSADIYALGRLLTDVAKILGLGRQRVLETWLAERPEHRPRSAREALQAFERSRKPPVLQLFAWAVSMVRRRTTDRWKKQSTVTVIRAPGVATTLPPPPARSPVSSRSRLPDNWNEPTAADEPDLPPLLTANRLPPRSAPRIPPEWDERSMARAVPIARAPDDERPSQADFSVIAPPLVTPGRHFVLELWIAPAGQQAAMLEQATRPARMVERVTRSLVNLQGDALITVMLRLPDFEVEEAVETLGWNGDIRNVGFMVKAPSSLPPGLYPGSVKLLQNSVPFASIWFDLQVGDQAGAAPPAGDLRGRVERIARGFASYASDDRAEVLRRVQGMRATGVDVFVDVMGLRTGEDWEPALYRQIDLSDGLFLFWSRRARESKWVEREWRYALAKYGADFINPVALEDPRLVKPPGDLASKHFNDMVLAFIAVEDARRSGAG